MHETAATKSTSAASVAFALAGVWTFANGFARGCRLSCDHSAEAVEGIGLVSVTGPADWSSFDHTPKEIPIEAAGILCAGLTVRTVLGLK